MAERDPNVIEEFKRRRTQQFKVTAEFFVVGGIALFLAGRGICFVGLPCSAMQILALGSVLYLLIFSLKNWRCPACNGYLGKAISPRFCSKCGAALQ